MVTKGEEEQIEILKKLTDNKITLPKDLIDDETYIIISNNYAIINFNGIGKQFQIDSDINIVYKNQDLNIVVSGRETTYKTIKRHTKILVEPANTKKSKLVGICPSVIGGILYTATGVNHITIPGCHSILRSRVAGECFPTSVANKFTTSESYNVNQLSEINEKNVYFPDRELGKPHSSGDLIILATNNSVKKIVVSSGDCPKITTGYEIIAWTAGIKFSKKSIWGSIIIEAEISEGIIWIAKNDN